MKANQSLPAAVSFHCRYWGESWCHRWGQSWRGPQLHQQGRAHWIEGHNPESIRSNLRGTCLCRLTPHQWRFLLWWQRRPRPLPVGPGGPILRAAAAQEEERNCKHCKWKVTSVTWFIKGHIYICIYSPVAQIIQHILQPIWSSSCWRE